MLSTEQRANLVELRRDFHRYPEIAHQEHRTAGVILQQLRDLGLDDVRGEVGQTGVVGVLKGGRPGKTVLLRADIDALPLVEADRGQPYRSVNNGAHHACGHDGHTAILLTVAEVLVAQRADLPGNVVFVFQPAEERVGGAAGMLHDGALAAQPDACFGLHLWNDVPVGTIDVRPGPIFASADAFAITLNSSGGHAAMPHQVADPIVAMAHLITLLQTLVSRETPPLEPGVLTIGSVHGGTAPNIIPSVVELQGTLRAFEPAVRQRLLDRLQQMVHTVSELLGVQGSILMTEQCPAVINNPAMADFVRDVATELLGAEHVTSHTRTAGADDMALFLNEVPGCYIFVGGANAERGLASPHHSPTFDFDERALEIGVDLLVAVTRKYLEQG